MRFYKEESEVRKHIVNIGTTASNFDIHLLGINAIAIAAAFRGDNRFEMRLAIPFIGDEINVLTLLNTLGKTVEYIDKSAEFRFTFSDSAIDFGA